MASIPASPDNLTGYPDLLEVNHLSAAELGAVEPPLFRFRLRQLFYFVAIVSFILAATVLSQGVAALAMLLASLVVAAHLFSTALASRLRSRADEARALARIRGTGPQRAEQFSEHANSPAIPRSARSPWHARGTTSLPWLPRLILAGVIVGGILGASVLGLTDRPPHNIRRRALWVDCLRPCSAAGLPSWAAASMASSATVCGMRSRNKRKTNDDPLRLRDSWVACIRASAPKSCLAPELSVAIKRDELSRGSESGRRFRRPARMHQTYFEALDHHRYRCKVAQARVAGASRALRHTNGIRAACRARR